MIVVAISGWKGSGKDTMADHLINEYGYTRMAFADILKDMVAEQYDINVQMLHDPDLKEVPLIQYPVESKDKFSSMIHNFMVREFRSKTGGVPVELKNEENKTLGLIRTKLETNKIMEEWSEVFWTPRALAILEGSIKRSANTEYWVQRVISQIEKSAKDNPRAKFVITDMRYQSEVGQLDHAFNQNLVTCKVKRFSTSPSTDPSERDLDDYPMDYMIDNTGTIHEFLNNVDDLVTYAEGSQL